jgi:hypothetical protein
VGGNKECGFIRKKKMKVKGQSFLKAKESKITGKDE